ncbi:hypothetical protein [Undibacterium sp. Di24W]|uniref:hypothetical protein n=1 Tax=Undibacterium sp. Di24W TaxID=3413033 RepID=UPI003BEFB2E0
MSLYLFTLYLATQATTVPMLDLLGFNCVASLSSISLQFEMAFIAGVAGLIYGRWKTY